MRAGLCKTGKIEDIVHTELIRAPLVTVFRAMTDAQIVDEWGGGPARIQTKVGGRYSLWDGEMHGTIKEIEFPHLLVFTWREEMWDKEIPDTLVRWSLEEHERGTRLYVTHSGLPGRRIREMHNDGWGEYFLGPLKAYLEYRS